MAAKLISTLRPALLAALALPMVFATGCASARLGVGLPEALLYRRVVTPVTMKRPEGAQRGEPITIPRDLAVGTARAYSIDLGFPTFGAGGILEVTRILSVGWGDMSVEKALANGNLEEVTYADGEIYSILRIFNRSTIIAYGPPAGSTPPAEEVAEQPPP